MVRGTKEGTAEMKEIWKALFDKITGDSTLMAMLGNDPEMVRRGYNPDEAPFSDTKTGAVLFRQWTGVPISPGVPVTDFNFMVVGVSKKSDVQATDIAERLKVILDRAQLTATGGYFYSCLFDAYDTGPQWVEDDDAWEEDLRFRIIATHDV